MKGLKYIILVPVFFAAASVGLNAQTDRRDVRKGNMKSITGRPL